MSGMRKVVLYKHGVGYFEREETIVGNGEVRLSFNESEMNDVLKSLVVDDKDQGTIQSISYDTQKPVEKLLSESALNLPASGGTQALLAKLRGARVRASLHSQTLEGQVVGLEEWQRQSADGIFKTARLTLLTGDSGLVGLDLAEVLNIQFLDETVKKELAFYYDSLAQGFKPGTKTLSIFGRGEGERRLAIGYVVEAPIWKTSYRFSLPESDQLAPWLEGWALVDNPQDEDWTDVQLSLVAGLPISFIHDLYSPRYIKRQEVRVETESTAVPVSMAPGFAGEMDLGVDPFMCCDIQEQEASAPAAAYSRAMMSREQSAAQVKTVTKSVGELFEYKIAHPVTVNRRQSALVPIAAGEFKGGRVVLYKKSERADNPFSAVEFHNSTGLTLEGGPVLVFEEDTYAGEAMLDTMKPEEMRIIPFAVDLSIRVESSQESTESEILRVEGTSNALLTYRRRIKNTVYRFHSQSSKAKLCWLEHASESGWELVPSQSPQETTKDGYRFKFDLPAKQVTKFEVKTQSETYHHFDYYNLSEDQLQWFHTSGFINDASLALLQEIVKLAFETRTINVQRNQLKNELSNSENEQQRLRRNLESLGTSSDEVRLRSRYVQKLEQLETQHEEQTKNLRSLDENYQVLTAKMDKLRSNVRIERNEKRTS